MTIRHADGTELHPDELLARKVREIAGDAMSSFFTDDERDVLLSAADALDRPHLPVLRERGKETP